MGKGQRVRASRAAEKEAMKDILAKKEKKQKASKLATTIIAIVLIVCIAGGLIYQTVYSSAFKRGDIQRNTVVLKSENYTVDAAMMSFYFYQQYNNFLNSYSSYLSSFGLDSSVSLRRQDCTLQTGSTWFEYFAEQSNTQVSELLYLAENAIDKGLKLDEADEKTIQNAIDNYKEFATKNSYDVDDIFSMLFGTGVQESDVRKCLELSSLADKYYQSFYDGLNYTDAEIDKYYTDHIDTYQYVDYYSYKVAATDTKDATTYAAAKAKAEQLAAVKDGAAFEKWVENHLRTTTVISEDFTEDDLKKNIEETIAGLKLTKVTRTKDNKASTWLFEEAKVGESYIEDDESGTYTVYLSMATPYRDEEITKSIRQLIFMNETYDKKDDATKAKAEEVLKLLKDEGLTEEAFKVYASQYSEDGATASKGGLCENYRVGGFDEAVGKWAFDANRKAGDLEIVKNDEGYAICYFVGDGDAGWKADCIAAKEQEDYDAAKKEWTAEISLTENKEGYNKIPDNVA